MDLGDLSVTLKAVFDRFNLSVDKAKDKLKKLGGEMRELVTKAAKLGAAAAAAGAAIIAGLVAAGLKAIDTNAKLSRSVDGTIDGLRGLQLAGSDAGVQLDIVNDAAVKLTARLGEVMRQGGPAAKILEDLGLSAEELARLDIDERFARIADAMQDANLSGAQQADILRQLGIEQKEVIELMAAGGDAIREARKEVDEFGISVSDIDAAKIEAANDAMARIKLTLEAVRNVFTVTLAPILQELADRFNTLSKENNGFREAAQVAVEFAIRGFAKVADVVQGLRVALKAGELVARGFGAAMVTGAEVATIAIVKFVDVGIKGVNELIEALNLVPGVEIATVDTWSNSPFLEGFKTMASEMRDQVSQTRAELSELALQELPSAKVEEFLEAVRDRANEAAEATANAKRAVEETQTGAAGFGDARGEAEDKAAEAFLERERARLMDRLDALREFTMTESEIEQKRHEERLAMLEEIHEAELVGDTEFHEQREALEAEHIDRMNEIRLQGLTEGERFEELSAKNKLRTVLGSMTQMTAGVSSESRRMFEINKKLALAQAAVSLPQAVLDSFKNAGGYPWGIAPAALMAATGLQQIRAIQKAQFGGTGGAAPSVVGTTAATPVSPVSAGGGQSIFIDGLSPDSLFTGKAVRKLLDEVGEVMKDGGRVEFAGA